MSSGFSRGRRAQRSPRPGGPPRRAAPVTSAWAASERLIPGLERALALALRGLLLLPHEGSRLGKRRHQALGPALGGAGARPRVTPLLLSQGSLAPSRAGPGRGGCRSAPAVRCGARRRGAVVFETYLVSYHVRAAPRHRPARDLRV